MTIFDAADLLDRLSGDADLLADLLDLFLEDCPVRLAAVHAAVATGRGPEIRAAAHALKGAAGNLSARRLFTAAQLLEQLAETSDRRRIGGAAAQIDSEAAVLLPVLRQHLTARAGASR